MSMLQIVYSSKNCIEGTPEQVEAEIASILQTSRANNALTCISGALLFNGHGFAQVLEGPAGAVEATYERIQCDPRHSDVVMLSIGSITKRTFADWSMAYADPGAIRANAGHAIDLDEICANPEEGGQRILSALHSLIAVAHA